MKWTKFYKDGTQVSSPNSWRNTSSDDIKYIELEYDGESFRLEGSRYWQWNSYECLSGCSIPKLVSMSIATEKFENKWQVRTINIYGELRAYPTDTAEIRKHGFVDGNVS